MNPNPVAESVETLCRADSVEVAHRSTGLVRGAQGRDACIGPVEGAVALTAALAGIGLRPALAAFLHAFAANLVSAGVRLVPLGQTDGQKALAALDPLVHHAAAVALHSSIDDLGGRSAMVDWTSMIHETQYTRLFRS